MAIVLVVEPDQILGETYRAALSKSGHEVLLQHQAQSGIFAVDQKKPDIILLELQLPGHGGIEFLHELRSYIEWQAIPVILHTMISAARLKPQLPRFLELGIIEYLYKPATNLQQLARAINRAV